MKVVNPILLAGGSGTRLWPLSRKSYPKQFSKVISDVSLFQSSAKRLASSNTIKFAPHITLTNADFRFIISEQLQEVGIDPGPILIEPAAKNTAAAILAGSIFAFKKNQDAVLLVAPSDHIIPDTENFHKTIEVGLSYVQEGKIVTFGIIPTHPETGYGYLELQPDKLDKSGTSELIRYIEKPSKERAEKMLDAGNFLWNAGIFLFRAQEMLDAFEAYAPETLDLVLKAFNHSSPDLGFLRLGEEHWSMLKDISIDYAIMEQTREAAVVPVDMEWSDIGSWSELWAISDKDISGNVITGDVFAEDTTGSYIKTYTKMVATVGLRDMVVVDTGDTVLVAPKDRAQDIGTIVKRLEKEERTEHLLPGRGRRPWGWYQTLDRGASFQVKRICVNAKSRLSLQRHLHRAEHWVVVSGEAIVHCDGKEITLSANQSTYIPVGASHRLENSRDEPLFLIEVQSGNYLGEDDIERIEDDFARK